MARAPFGDAREACGLARRENTPIFSRSYFAPSEAGFGAELIDLCLPLQVQGRDQGFLVATFELGRWLESALAGLPALRHRHEISFIESDGARLARAGTHRGSGVFVAESVVDLPGRAIRLRADSVEGHPSLLPNVTVALVLGLSVALTAMVLVLARDVRRRERAEAALGEALAIRRAMEDSLPTGLRARDLEGRVTYVNPAFCKMVGFSAEELLGQTTPPYWPPEDIAVYAARQPPRRGPQPATEAEGGGLRGFETRFMRRDGERFPVMVYEAPLVDGQGRQAGWMSAVLDISEQRRVEDLSRLQQERMQATARLATVGEMASLLSHELNQPLSAIASYAAGSLNLLDDPDPGLTPMLREALDKIAAQAERAGQVIRSVHDFVRRRAQDHERVSADTLVQSVLPLVGMQARKSGARIETDLPADMLAVRCDRTMMEQVLLNLARNGLQAMEQGTEPAQRVLRIEVRSTDPRWISFAVVDAGIGIPPEVAPRLFTPFFTTRDEGMGLGLSLCRTVVELHGGALDFESPRRDRPADATWAGSRFRFTLAAL